MERPREYSLAATFPDSAAAERAAAAVREAEDGVIVAVGSHDAERDALYAEMRDELEATVVGAGNVGPFTKGMTKGLMTWVPIGTVAGALIGLLFGFLPWPDVGTVLRFLIWGVAGAFAGATAGFVIGGLAKPIAEHEGEELQAEAGVNVSVGGEDPAVLERARSILERYGASRVQAVGPGGPRGPSGEDATRPVRGEDPS